MYVEVDFCVLLPTQTSKRSDRKTALPCVLLCAKRLWWMHDVDAESRLQKCRQIRQFGRGTRVSYVSYFANLLACLEDRWYISETRANQ